MRILVRQDIPVDKIGSFFVPSGKEIFDNVGVILAIGSGISNPEIRVGMRCAFKRRAHGHGQGALVPDTREPHDPEHENILVLFEEDILAELVD